MTLEDAIARVESAREIIRFARAAYAEIQKAENCQRVTLFMAERNLRDAEATREHLAQEANAARYAAQQKK